LQRLVLSRHRDPGCPLRGSPSEDRRGSGTGVRGLEKGEAPATIAYLTVTNLDESLTAAQKEGARVVLPKTEIPGMGWHAMVHAPGDVPIGLFQGT